MRAIKLYYSEEFLPMVPYVTVDWTVLDLPKQIHVPLYAWSDVETDLKLQIAVNTYFNLKIDIPDDDIRTVYNSETGTLLVSYAKEEELNDIELASLVL